MLETRASCRLLETMVPSHQALQKVIHIDDFDLNAPTFNWEYFADLKSLTYDSIKTDFAI